MDNSHYLSLLSGEHRNDRRTIHKDLERALNRIHHAKSNGWHELGRCSTTELYSAFKQFASVCLLFNQEMQF